MPYPNNDIWLPGSDWGSGWWNAPRTNPISAGGGGQTLSYSPVVTPGASGVTPAGGMNLTELTTYINDLNRQAQTQANQARIPQAPALEQASSANIRSELAGQIPDDVMRLLRRQAAERGVGGPGAGSGAETAGYLQALGLTSLDLTGRGQQELTAAYARNPAAPLFDPSSQLITPAQSSQLQLEQQRLQLERERQQLEAALARVRAGGGGGGGGGRTPAYAGESYPTTTMSAATMPLTGRSIPPLEPFDQADWWSSIGYGANPNASATSTAPVFYAGPNPANNFTLSPETVSDWYSQFEDYGQPTDPAAGMLTTDFGPVDLGYGASGLYE